MLILGIETSCDETAVALVRDGHEVLCSLVHSQVAKHRPYGGVVPELASRCHVETLPYLLEEALGAAKVLWSDIDAIAATRGPGLATALIVGWNAAKGLSLSLGKPLIGVNHIEAHIYSPFLTLPPGHPALSQPFVALVVSGGHTALYRVGANFGRIALLGRTIDDAAGEALDKAANLLGLGYPGGPAIDALSRGVAVSTPNPFPTGKVRGTSSGIGDLAPELCFSFSGLKTSLRQRLLKSSDVCTATLAADYQAAVVEALVSRCAKALAAEDRYLVVGGGVSLNSRLREELRNEKLRMKNEEWKGVEVLLATPQYCGDNAAMVAGVAFYRQPLSPIDIAFDVDPTLAVK